MKSLFNDLRAFAIRGNVIDMAVGIIIGVAFGKIVSSLVNDILMPPLGLLIGKMDFSYLVWTLQSPFNGNPAVNIRYGIFINTIVDFCIIAFSTFMVIKGISNFKKREEKREEIRLEYVKNLQTSDTNKTHLELLAEIRDILKSKQTNELTTDLPKIENF